MEIICGIYKITSPSGRIYIGQSINIYKRFKSYRNCKNKQTILERSFAKYGVNNHMFEIIHTCQRNNLNELEIFYINKFNSFDSKKGLNSKGGGQSGGVCSEALKRKLRKPKSDEAKENYRQAALNRKPVSEETKAKHRANMIGNKRAKGGTWNIGKVVSEETKSKIIEKRKLQVMPKGYKRPKFSDEWLANMSKAVSGDKNPNSNFRKSQKKQAG